MEYQHFSFFAITNSLLIIFLAILLTWRKSRSKTNFSKLPPEPWKLPIIGNLHQMVGSMPHIRLAQLAKKYGPIIHLQLGEISNIVISSPEIAKKVLTTHDLAFADRPSTLVASILSYGPTGIAFSKYGEYWRQVRKICILELLSEKRVQSFKSTREEKVWSLVKSIESNVGSAIDLSELIFSLSSSITFTTAFGKLCEKEDAFVPVAKTIIDVFGGFRIADVFPSNKLLFTLSGLKATVTRVHKEVDKILQNIIDEHKARRTSPGSEVKNDAVDLVDVLLNLQHHGDLNFSLTNDNIKAIILDMFSAGTETSSTVIEWTMSELLRNPQMMKKAQTEVREVYQGEEIINETKLDELKYLKLVIKESLRLHAPLPLLIPRQSREAVEISGYMIPSNTTLILNVWAISRDSKHWKEPERFNPERLLNDSIDYKGTNFEFIPFGAGRRKCPGIQYGMAVVELVLANLLYHFDWKLPNEMKHEDLDMTAAFGIVLGRKNPLYLIPVKYIS